ncbi:hypothetical protein F4780DRAFT_775137 [Xylariomycetidae sp. FL0641]|nr:hypothetical protein F4780DRAFT_775137 [Xylariomycetidae sp. FL0641]
MASPLVRPATDIEGTKFAFMAKIGATNEAVAVLNDQPYVFTILVVSLLVQISLMVFIWFIHWATYKPEQKKAKEDAKKKKAAKKGPGNGNPRNVPSR